MYHQLRAVLLLLLLSLMNTPPPPPTLHSLGTRFSTKPFGFGCCCCRCCRGSAACRGLRLRSGIRLRRHSKDGNLHQLDKVLLFFFFFLYIYFNYLLFLNTKKIDIIDGVYLLLRVVCYQLSMSPHVSVINYSIYTEVAVFAL